MDEKSFSTKQSSSSKDVLDFYDLYAASWDERFGTTESVKAFHKIRFESFIKLAGLDKGKTCAELGVGTGPYVTEIAPMVKNLVCVDGSQGMLDVLEKKVSQLKNIQLKQIDLSKPLGKTPFKADVIYFFGLIEHVIDIDTLMENCKLMLNSGGRIVVISSNGLSPWYHGIRKPFRGGIHCTSDKYYSRNSLGRIMQAHGFNEKQCLYWGFFPAGVKGIIYRFFKAVGAIIERTPLKKFGGGMTISYESA